MLIYVSAEPHTVDIPHFDQEHADLFRLCGELERATSGGAGGERAQAIATDLVIHTAQHFDHEEREMRGCGYAHYDWHRRQHHSARVKVRALERRIRRGDLEAAGELAEYLSGWLSDHVRLADRMYGAYFRNRQREQTARAAG